MVHKIKKLETKDWAVVKSGDMIAIYKKLRGKKFDPLEIGSSSQFRGTLEEEESNWQPASIQVVKDNMKDMEESNVSIFFDESDLKKKTWGNKGLPKA
jgi:hypothetical protein